MRKAIATEISRIYGMSFTTVPTFRAVSFWDFKDQGFRMETDPQDGRVFWMYNGKMGSYKWLEDKPSEWNTGTDASFLPTVRRSRRLGK